MKPKVIAFYLPQYHPTPENDKWWGKGFTEWTNVGKAKPLFKGHYQPKVPADLGYYDLRLPQVKEAQVQLAIEAGVYGFCYYHYWFGNGKQLLEKPFEEVLASKEPEFPFMLCWANESWHRKFWDKDGKGYSKEVLAEQTYPGIQDIDRHFYYLLPAFKDERYIKIDSKPAFMIYKPFELKDGQKLINRWNELALKEGLQGIFFIGSVWLDADLNNITQLEQDGFNGINTLGMWHGINQYRSILKKISERLISMSGLRPRIYDYRKVMKSSYIGNECEPNIFPTIVPNWDHTPRSGANGTVLTHSSPSEFYHHVKDMFSMTHGKKNNIIFLKSWNEWGEGNYMEPDLKYGKGYIEVLKRAVDEINEV